MASVFPKYATMVSAPTYVAARRDPELAKQSNG